MMGGSNSAFTECFEFLMSADLIRLNTWYSCGSCPHTGNLTQFFVGGFSMRSPNQSEPLRSPILAHVSGGGVTIINVF